MSTLDSEQSVHRNPLSGRLPPRERILVAARELFFRQGIQGVSVETIAETAGTNKMTLYRHFESKDQLVAEYLRGLSVEALQIWDDLAERYPDDPISQIGAWLHDAAGSEPGLARHGCAMVNAAIQIADPEHPGRKVVEDTQRIHRQRLTALCCASSLAEPEQLADQLFLLVEGARVASRSVGPNGPSLSLCSLAAALIDAHRRPAAGEQPRA